MASNWVRYSVAVYAGLLLAGSVVSQQPPPVKAAWARPRPQASLVVERPLLYTKTHREAVALAPLGTTPAEPTQAAVHPATPLPAHLLLVQAAAPVADSGTLRDHAPPSSNASESASSDPAHASTLPKVVSAQPAE